MRPLVNFFLFFNIEPTIDQCAGEITSNGIHTGHMNSNILDILLYTYRSKKFVLTNVVINMSVFRGTLVIIPHQENLLGTY